VCGRAVARQRPEHAARADPCQVGQGAALVEPGHRGAVGSRPPAGSKTPMSLVPAAHFISGGLPRPVPAAGHARLASAITVASARSILLTWANRP
jgi:hypothetical protein